MTGTITDDGNGNYVIDYSASDQGLMVDQTYIFGRSGTDIFGHWGWYPGYERFGVWHINTYSTDDQGRQHPSWSTSDMLTDASDVNTVRITGSRFVDDINLSWFSANNTMYGGGGDDDLTGGSGNDLLNGGARAPVNAGRARDDV